MSTTISIKTLTRSDVRPARTWGTLAAAILMSVAGPTAWGATSSSLNVLGQVDSPRSYDLSALQNRSPASQVTQTDVFASGAGTQTHTYTGPSLWNVLNNTSYGAGGITVSGAKNDVLNKVVLVTATDGYKVVYSAGELSPNFGNEQALLAWGETTAGTLAPLGGDGFARTTAPLDAKGGRYVSNVTSIQVLNTGSTVPYTGAAAVSTAFTVSGDVKTPGTIWDLAALKGLASVTQTVGGHTYTGISLWSFLNAASVGLATNSAVKNDLLDMYVVAVGADGYKAAFSMGELSPDFGNSLTPDDSHPLLDLIAYQMDGEDLTSSGFARVVAPNDLKQGRWVSNLVGLEIYHAAPVPEPEACILVLAGVMLVRPMRRNARR